MSITDKSKIALALVGGLALCGSASAGDYNRFAPRPDIYAPIVVVPYCTPRPPAFGLSCVPRALPPATDDVIALQDSLQFSRRSLRRPYQQTFAWP